MKMALVVCLFVAAACSSNPPAAVAPPASAPTAATGAAWTVAVVGPFAGTLAATGQDFKTAAQLYADKQNARGGWVGRAIALQFVDEGNSDANGGATAAQTVAADPGVLIVFGHFSSSSALAAGPIYQQAQLPFIATTASSPVVTQGGNPWLFRSGTTAVQEGASAVRLMRKLGKSKTAIVYSSADFGKAQANSVASAVRSAGFAVVSENDYQPGAQDFSSIISKVKDVQPDFVWLGMYDAEAGPFIQQARSAGLNSSFAGSGAILTDVFLQLAGSAADDVYADSAPLAIQAQNLPDLGAFVDAYRTAYGHDPDGFAEGMYTDFQIVGQALGQGASNRQTLRDKLATLTNLKNISGIGAFDKNRDGLTTEHQISVVKAGQWQLFTTFQ